MARILLGRDGIGGGEVQGGARRDGTLWLEIRGGEKEIAETGRPFGQGQSEGGPRGVNSLWDKCLAAATVAAVRTGRRKIRGCRVCAKLPRLASIHAVIHAFIFLCLASPMALSFSVTGSQQMALVNQRHPRSGICSINMQTQGGQGGHAGEEKDVGEKGAGCSAGRENGPMLSRRGLLIGGSAIVWGSFLGVPKGMCEEDMVKPQQGLFGRRIPLGAKAVPESPIAVAKAEKTISLRAELEEIKRQLQADLKALDKQFASAVKDTARQLEALYEADNSDNDITALPDEVTSWNPMSDKDVERNYKAARLQLEKAIREVDLKIVAERGEEEERKVRSSFEKKKAEILKQVRTAEGRVKDPALKKELKALEQEILAVNDPIAPRDLQGAVNDRMSQVRNFVGKKVLENEKLLRELDEKKPSFLPRFIDTEVDGDKLYVTVPFLGSDFKVRKTMLSTTQIFTGGLWAGAAGELFKDVISFPLDTIRTRLMTQGSFQEPVEVDKASNRQGTVAPSPDPRDLVSKGKEALSQSQADSANPSEPMSTVSAVLQRKTVTLSRPSEASEDLPEGTYTIERKSFPNPLMDAISMAASRAVASIKGKVTDTMEAAQTRTIYRGSLREVRKRPRNLNFIKQLNLPPSLGTQLENITAKISVPTGLFSNLYTGAPPTFLFSPVQGAVFFGVKDYLYYTLPKLGLDAVQVFIVAVVISDSIYWLIRCPAETMKTRLQTKVDSGPIQSFQNIIQQSGIKGFYRGYIPLMQLDLPFTAINFAIYSAYKVFIEMSQGHDPTATDLFVGGFIAAAFTAGVTTPLNVASTRILLSSGSSEESTRSSTDDSQESGKVGAVGNDEDEAQQVQTRRYETMLGTLKSIYAEEGPGALFKGVIPRVLQLGTNHALRFTGYEATKGVVTKEMLFGGGGGATALFGAVAWVSDALAVPTVNQLAPWIDLFIEFSTNVDVMYMIYCLSFLL